MKKTLSLAAKFGGTFIVLATSGLMLYGCMNTNDAPNATAVVAPTSNGTAASVSSASVTITNACVPLIAGQNINVGQVCSTIDGSDLVVTYSTTSGNGWSISEYELWVGTKPEDIPQNKKGNPVPGQFTYKATSLNTNTVVVHVPLSSIGFDPNSVCGQATAIIASHAVVKSSGSGKNGGSQTAWGSGIRINAKGNWGTYQTISLSTPCFVCPNFLPNAGGISFASPQQANVGDYVTYAPVFDFAGVTLVPGTCVNTEVLPYHPYLPAGLTLDPSTCIISGTATAPTAQTIAPPPAGTGPASPIYYKVNAMSNCGPVGAVIQIFVAP